MRVGAFTLTWAKNALPRHRSKAHALRSLKSQLWQAAYCAGGCLIGANWNDASRHCPCCFTYTRV
jgi:hypothetical protein